MIRDDADSFELKMKCYKSEELEIERSQKQI
jgi:hypothetical protein